MMCVLNIAHRQSEAIHPILGPKGDHPYMIEAACMALDTWGLGEVLLKSDQEPAVQKLIAQVAQRRRAVNQCTQVVAAPRRSHASMGTIENANRQIGNGIRVLKLQLEGGLGRRVPIYHPIMAWLVRHVGWLVMRYAVRQATGRTAHQILRGKHYRGEIATLGEEVWARLPGERRLKADAQWRRGIWLGKTDRSDEHLVAAAIHDAACSSRWSFRVQCGQQAQADI